MMFPHFQEGAVGRARKVHVEGIITIQMQAMSVITHTASCSFTIIVLGLCWVYAAFLTFFCNFYLYPPSFLISYSVHALLKA